MADTSAPVDDATLREMIQQARDAMAPPPAPKTAGDGTGFSGFIGDVGNVLAGGGTGLLDLSPGEEAAAGRKALLNFGINLLAASGPSYAPKDFGTVLAQGLQGAMSSREHSDVLAYNRAGQANAAANQRLEQIGRLLPLLQLQQNAKILEAQRAAVTGGTTPTDGASTGSASDKIKALADIAQRESGGDPTALNYVARQDPTAYDRGATASGKYQIVNSTWRDGMQLAGLDPSKYATARDAPEAVQDQVAGALYDKYGTKPWQKGARDWVRDEQGRYQLATVRPPAGSPGGAPAGTPGTPAAPARVQVAAATPTVATDASTAPPAATTEAPALPPIPAPTPAEEAGFRTTLTPEELASFEQRRQAIRKQAGLSSDPEKLAAELRTIDDEQNKAAIAQREKGDAARVAWNQKQRDAQTAEAKAQADAKRALDLETTKSALALKSDATKKVMEPIIAKADAAQAMLKNAQNLELFARQQGPANALWSTDFGKRATNWIVTLGGNSEWAREAAARQSWDTLVNGMFNDVHVPGMGAQSDRETGMLQSQWGGSAQTPLDRMTQLAIIRKNAEARINDANDVTRLVETGKSASDIHDMRRNRQIFDRPPSMSVPTNNDQWQAVYSYNASHPMGEPYVTWAPRKGGTGGVLKWARNTGDPNSPVELLPNVEVTR